MDSDHTPRKRSGLTENLTGRELFVYDADGLELTVLNRSALMIWSLCDGTHTLDDMLPVLAGIYPDAPPHRLRDDTITCLQSFAGNQLLEPDHP
jgi:hypothetical protein